MNTQLTPAAFALLLALSAADRHGYALIGDVTQLSGGSITLGPGTLYRTLQRLRANALIEEIAADTDAPRADRRSERQRRYRITPAGRQAAHAHARHLATLLNSQPAQALLADRDDER